MSQRGPAIDTSLGVIYRTISGRQDDLRGRPQDVVGA